MKIFIQILSLVSVYLWLSDEGQVMVAAQLPRNLTHTFSNMTLDLLHRGTFKITACAREMINCYEYIKPDQFCTRAIKTYYIWFFFPRYWADDFYYGSVCDYLRKSCDDYRGQMSDQVPMFEAICESVWRS